MRLNFITLILLFAWCWIPNEHASARPNVLYQWNATQIAEGLLEDAAIAIQAPDTQATTPTPTPPGEEIPQPTDVRLMRGMILLAAISAAVILIGVWINRQRANLR
jgi:hypothetical protein